MPLDTLDQDLEKNDVALAPEADESEAEEKRGLLSRIPKNLRPWLAAVVVALIAGGAWLIWGTGAKKPEIVTAAVTRGDVEQTVLATGVLEPSKLVSVGAQASGQVKKLYVELGDTVKAGDPIADIDSRNQLNTVSNAEAGLSSVTAQRAAASASLTQAQINFDRQQRLYTEGAAAKADLDSAKAQLANAQASLTAANSQIKQSSLQLNTAQTNLGYTKILAPMDGTIVAVVTEEGQTVNANQSAPTIVMLAQLQQMTVSAQISEADVEKVTSGQDVYFTTLGDTNTRHYAKLRAVAPAPESIESQSTSQASSSSASAVYYNGLFDVENKDGKLRTGMTAQVYIVQASAKDTVIVPSSALERRGRGQYAVKVVDKDGKVEERPVKIGINTSVDAQVLEGLKEGEKVVVAQASGAKSGQNGQQQRNPLNPMAGGQRRGAGAGGFSGGGGPRPGGG
jgi:macrolide-specific efflux system membrane fusion protein